MWLVLCSAADPAGLWAYEGLRQLGLTPLELVTVESLAYDSQWEHRLDGGGTHLKVTLADGRVLCSSRVRGAINRVLAPPPQASRQAVPADREYAQAEWFAFYLSWLNGLPGVVINRPTALGLSGPWYHSSEWVLRAGRAGLPTPVYHMTGRDTADWGYGSLAPDGAATLNLITLRGEVFGAQVPESLVRACGKLAQDAATEMLGIELYAAKNGEWTFAKATPSPDLTLGGLPLLQRLAQVLTQRGDS